MKAIYTEVKERMFTDVKKTGLLLLSASVFVAAGCSSTDDKATSIQPTEAAAVVTTTSAITISATTTSEETGSIDQLPIKNLRHPEPMIYSGGQPTKEDFIKLADAGVKVIINLRPDDEQDWDEGEYVELLGMTYYSLPITTADDLNVNNATVLDALLRNVEGETTLVHCASGNRVGGLMAVREGLLKGAEKQEALKTGEAWGMTSLTPIVDEILTREE